MYDTFIKVKKNFYFKSGLMSCSLQLTVFLNSLVDKLEISLLYGVWPISFTPLVYFLLEKMFLFKCNDRNLHVSP